QFLVRTATRALLSHRPAAGRAPRPPQELMRGGITTNGRARWPGERAAAASADEDAMHKNEFIRQVARESGLPQATVAQVLGAAVRVVARALVAGQKVVWTGFGTFEVRRRSARQGINPQTRQ